VGLDEFAFHPAAPELWAAASGRVTWGYDLAIWSSHRGPDSLFAQFVREARLGAGKWSYYRVTLPDAIEMGLVEKIARTTGQKLTREGFLEECRTRARFPEVFEQEYLCNATNGGATIVPWEAIERCQTDDVIERAHWEEAQIAEMFGEFQPANASARQQRIEAGLRGRFGQTLGDRRQTYRLGFDVAASGRGSLSVFYIDRVAGEELRLAALLTCRTQDWHFLKSALMVFLRNLANVRACGDETGLGRQICWEAAKECPWAFKPVNFSGEKTALGFELMNQLALGRKRFPRAAAEVAADYFALHKRNTAGHWSFTESPNPLNAASHCDIAWAGALASRAQSTAPCPVTAMVMG
jgi:phage FluMu gp28-like protein